MGEAEEEVAEGPIICAGGRSHRGGGTVDAEMGETCGRLDDGSWVSGGAAEVPDEPVGKELSLGVCLVATWQACRW